MGGCTGDCFSLSLSEILVCPSSNSKAPSATLVWDFLGFKQAPLPGLPRHWSYSACRMASWASTPFLTWHCPPHIEQAPWTGPEWRLPRLRTSGLATCAPHLQAAWPPWSSMGVAPPGHTTPTKGCPLQFAAWRPLDWQPSLTLLEILIKIQE